MSNINILDYVLRSSQGDAKQTLESIKNSNTNISTKVVATFEQDIVAPYFLFQERVAEDKDEISNAIKEIVLEISNKLTLEQKKKTALLIGTSLADINMTKVVENFTQGTNSDSEALVKKSIDSYAQEISKELGLHPFTMTITTACTSSANALLEAKNLISANLFDYAIVVGVEISFTMMSNGFSSLNLLSLTTQKPFDIARDGLVLGEAIAGVLIGRDIAPWSLLGGYSNCDSSTITSVSQSGEEFENVILQALEVSGIKKEEISAVKAHATSTPSNDIAEINAISRVFDEDIVFTAIKPYVGHTLGACGILELAVLMACIDDGFIPKTVNCNSPILDAYLPIGEHKPCNNGIFMLNYFGFGGNNTSLIVKKELL